MNIDNEHFSALDVWHQTSLVLNLVGWTRSNVVQQITYSLIRLTHQAT